MKAQYTGYLGALNENAKYAEPKCAGYDSASIEMQEARCCMKKKLREIHCDYRVLPHQDITTWFYNLRIKTIIPDLEISLAMHYGPTILVELAWVQDRTHTIEPFFTEYYADYGVVSDVIKELQKLDSITSRRYE